MVRYRVSAERTSNQASPQRLQLITTDERVTIWPPDRTEWTEEAGRLSGRNPPPTSRCLARPGYRHQSETEATRANRFRRCRRRTALVKCAASINGSCRPADGRIKRLPPKQSVMAKISRRAADSERVKEKT